MGDAELSKIGRHLASIDNSMKELVKIFATLNQNFVDAVKKLEAAGTIVDPEQLTIDEENAETLRRLKVRTTGQDEDWRQSDIAEGYKGDM
jgi:DNA anti-recombination protein RmuC